MIKHIYNKPDYTEEYDLDGLRELMEMALQDKVPNGDYSDMSCCVWSLFRECIVRSAEKRKEE